MFESFHHAIDLMQVTAEQFSNLVMISVNGGAGADQILGSSLSESINGGDGNDWIYAGPGADQLMGGTGNDTLLGGAGADSLQGDDGNDALRGQSGPDSMSGGVGSDTLVGNNSTDTINATDTNDSMITETSNLIVPGATSYPPSVTQSLTINPTSGSVFVGAGDGAPVCTVTANIPNNQLTWSMPQTEPFDITGDGLVIVKGVLDTEYREGNSGPPGEYKVDVTATDGCILVTETITITITPILTLNGLTIRVHGKSDTGNIAAAAGFILQGGSGENAGLGNVHGLVKEAAHELLKNANGGDVVLLTTGTGDKLWNALWTEASQVTPRINSVVAMDFDYGALTDARARSIKGSA